MAKFLLMKLISFTILQIARYLQEFPPNQLSLKNQFLVEPYLCIQGHNFFAKGLSSFTDVISPIK